MTPRQQRCSGCRQACADLAELVRFTGNRLDSQGKYAALDLATELLPI